MSATRGRLGRVLVRYHRVITIAVHLLLTGIANYAAFLLRFDGSIPPEYMPAFLQALPWLLAVRTVVFLPFGLDQGLWRYTSIWDLKRIIHGAVLSTLVFWVVLQAVEVTGYPRSVLVIDTIGLILLMGGVRLTRRITRELGHLERRKRVLVYGAGDAGEMIVRDMRHDAMHEYEPIGFIDDDRTKLGRRIHGVRVLGGRDDLARVIDTTSPDAILIAMPRVAPPTIREILKILAPLKIPIQTLPNLRDIFDGVRVSQIRDLSVEDLLERAPVGLAPERIRRLIAGRRIMVTGAGGSIGAELCRQIAELGPAALIMYERYENGLHAISNELLGRSAAVPVHPVIGDVTDVPRLHATIAEYGPHIVFHAAAHKHVPLMEMSPCEAVKNNVMGTRIVAEAAAKNGVERVILVSTDKAVNPSSVMGATKKMAELLVQAMNSAGSCVFTVVRFGNVLGSNGSVLPLFLHQIKEGGPVTVTHPEVRRYFMLCSEAVQLVLHAAALAEGAEIFVLEMGEQIRVLDMARNVIRLAGYVPEKEIPISIVGLRPGEKLFEELVGEDETVESSGVPEILRVRPSRLPRLHDVTAGIAELEGLAVNGDADAVIKQIAQLLPTYRRRPGVSDE